MHKPSALFSKEFSERILSAQENIDSNLAGILIHSDNFQALSLASRKFDSTFKSIYIDPPYNTDSSAIPYKNSYKHSSWATLMRDRVWLRHVVGIAIVLGWVVGVCGISLPLYFGAIVYPSVSIALLRSFAEHRAAPDPRHRTAIVEAHPFWGLLFLNNQLHFVHHAKPHLPWYELPRAWRDMKPSAEIGPGLLFYGGYREIAQRYLFRPFIPVEHPGWEAE